MLAPISIWYIVVLGGFIMTTRKIIQFGKNSFVISLPKAWVERNKLSKGSEVNLDESPSTVLVSPKEKELLSETKIKKINCEEHGKKVGRSIISAYINNYSIIEVYGQNLLDYTKEIEEITHNLVALEIMEQTPKKIIIKDFLNTQDISIENIIKRMDIIIRAMFSEIEDIFSKNEKVDLDKRDYDVNRLFYVGQKLLNKLLDNPTLSKTLNVEIRETIFYWQIIDSLERIADQQKRFARNIVEIEKDKVTKEILKKAFEKVTKEYLVMIKGLYNFDSHEADIVLSSKTRILDELEDTLEKTLLKQKDTLIIHNVTEAFERLKRFETGVAMMAKAIINKE